MKIGNRKISDQKPPFVVGEISGNHNGSLNNAIKMIKLAKKANLDAVKFQTYTADTITMKSNRKEFFITDKKNIWKNMSLHKLYDKASTPWNWHETIFKEARKSKILCFSSPFDETAVDLLEDLKAPAYKIASFENMHYPLIQKVAKTKKPMIISTGLATLKELVELKNFLKEIKCKNYALLKCTSSYPAKSFDLNLRTILNMKKKFNCEIGFSDHTIGISAALGAVALGATIIEKHFVLKKNMGIDSKFSSDFKEIAELKKKSLEVWQSLGKTFYGPTKSEKIYKTYTRSIYAQKDIKIGDKFTNKNIKIIRPGYGLHPKFFKILLRKRSKKNIKFGSPIKRNYF